jgi:hypothetical protein
LSKKGFKTIAVKVFRKELVRGTIYLQKQVSDAQTRRSQAFFGRGKYGSEAISSANVHSLPIEQEKQYMYYEMHS